jgi:DNA-binding IclR family transcriptional regulator
VLGVIDKMINNKHDSLRKHLKKYLTNVVIDKTQIKNLASTYNLAKNSVKTVARDLVAQGFLRKVGQSFKLTDWVTKL